MNSTNWKISARNLLKNISLSLINVLGLAVGLASSILILMHVAYEYSYDKNWEKADNIYRISYTRFQNGELSFKSARTLGGMAPVLKEKVPEVVGSTQLFKDVVTVYNEDNQIADIQMYVADSTFQSVFKLDYIDKKTDNPLIPLYSSVISESAALSLFGTINAVGKWFKVCQGWRFCVTGVYKDLPTNSHISFDMLLSLQTYYHYYQNWDDETGSEIIKNPKAHIMNKQVTNWEYGYNGWYSYLLAESGTDPKQLESKIATIAIDYTKKITDNNGKAEFQLQPIKSIHLNSHLDNEIKANGDRTSVMAMVFIALVILIIAWINFVNLTLIRAVEHAKSIGIRKIAGAMKKHLVFQFMIEALITNLISVLIAVGLVFLLKNWFSSLSNLPILASIGWPYTFMLTAILLAGVLISGIYPALYLSSFKAIDLFKGLHTSVTNSLDLRKFLVVAQFTASIFLIAGVITVFKQINYMKSRDLGVNIEKTLVTFSPPTQIGRPQRMSKLNTYKEQIRQTPGVESVTTSSILPGKEILWKKQDVRKVTDQPNNANVYAYANVDYDFIPTFNLKLLAGQGFSREENESNNAMIVNESAVKQLGYPDPLTAINTVVMVGNKGFKIIGVLKDYHHESLRKEIKPIIFFYGYKWMSDIGYYSIKMNTANLDQTIARIENIWKQTYPEDHFQYFFLDDEFNAQYKADQAFGRVFTLFTFLAIFIAAIGLFGLAVYSANQRTKEIGVRKVNGAKNSEILIMLNRNFAKWVVIAFVIATPLAWFILNKWLENFAYQTNLSWWIFAMSGIISLAIAIITVTWQSWKAATRNPVEALRYE
ncbi:MAG: ABC transporter permease [Mariniphaga sp.]